MIHHVVTAACSQQPKPLGQSVGWQAPEDWVLCPGCGAETVPPDTTCASCIEERAQFKAKAEARSKSWPVRFWRWVGLRD